MKFHEHISRSVAKALTFRAVVLITNSVLIYLITRRYDLTVGFLVTSNIINTILYIIHERWWNHIHWGKTHHPNGRKRH